MVWCEKQSMVQQLWKGSANNHPVGRRLQQLWKSSAKNRHVGSRCDIYEKAVQTTLMWWAGATTTVKKQCKQPSCGELVQQLWKSSANNLPVVSRCNNSEKQCKTLFFGEHVCNDYEKAVQTTVLWWEGMQQLWKSCANDGPVGSRCDNCENCANNRPTVRRYETTLKKQCKQPACREQVSNNSEKAVREMLVHEVSVHEV